MSSIGIQGGGVAIAKAGAYLLASLCGERAAISQVKHIALPPQLPQTCDENASYDQDLVDTSILSLQDLLGSVGDEDSAAVAAAIDTVNNLHRCRNTDGDVDKAELGDLLDEQVSSSTEAIIPLEIKKQNAGVLIGRCEDNISFDFFELSPTNEAAMSKGRLVRIFPSSSAKIAISKMEQPDLREIIAHVLGKMSTQTAPAFQPESTRDTAHPGLITDYFMNVTAALGEAADAIRVRKHTREDVLWSNSKRPWRRSALWLLIRVSLQLLFHRRSHKLRPQNQLYKSFVVLLLSRVLDLAKEHWTDLGSDSIQVITAKIVRRIRKMENSNPDVFRQSDWAKHVRARVTAAHDFVASHWKYTCQSAGAIIDTGVLKTLEPETDLHTSLPDLDAFLCELSSRRSKPVSSTFKPTSTYPNILATELPDDFDVSDESINFRLAAVEKWVEKHLEVWVEQHSQDPSTCGKLRRLIERYHPVASAAYAKIPVSVSVMHLTIFEIWVKCDTLACAESPLLRCYDPEIPLEELQCLCLPLKRQLERLHAIEAYIQERQNAAVNANPSIYCSFGHPSSFAVKYFDRSTALQSLMAEITRTAASKEQKKHQELIAKKGEHSNIMARYNAAECDFEEVEDNTYPEQRTESRHMRGCSRCALKRQAVNLRISIYERPLSTDSSIAKATVFELRVPETFSDWRDASMYIIANVLEFQNSHPEKPQADSNRYTLDLHHDLSHVLGLHYRNRRIILLSETKPCTGTTKRSIPYLEEGDVCVKNALSYAYYDKSQQVYCAKLRTNGKMTSKALYQMPERSKALSRFLYKAPSAPDGLPVNEPIASVNNCPGHFSIDEYKAFGMAPLGRFIIHPNLLAYLAMPSLDFAKAETQALILQIVQQVGPSNAQVERASHSILTKADFSVAMLDKLEVALRDRSENWESWRASATFSLIARRILSLTSSQEVVERCHEYLGRVRDIAMNWLQRLKQRIESSTDEAQRSELHLKATEVALLCIDTFDIEETYFDTALEQPFAFSTLIHCSIKVRENIGSLKTKPDALHDILVQSWRSLMFRLFPKLRDLVSRSPQELNRAVVVSWAAFQPASGTAWNSLPTPQEHWFYITSGTVEVYLNLLTAELLVDGTPLTRLPIEYTQHPLYTSLFGKLFIEVAPTSQPGMRFSAKSTYHGHKIHFGMEDNDLFIVAIKENTRLDLLPSRMFQGQLPHAFVNEFLHWYDHTTDEVVFRSRDSPWSFESEMWRLNHNSNDKTWRLFKPSDIKSSDTVISPTSNTARVLSRLFQGLEEQEHIHIVFENRSQTVSIELPRLQLGFYVGQLGGRIHSRQFRGMILDSDQTIGTLIGLSSKLVLRNERSCHERLVLIPVPRAFGKDSVTYTAGKGPNTVHASINKDESTRVYAYSLDKDLGRVMNTGDIQSQLFLCYLHIITSFCLPDPLIKMTGIEAAVSILQSAAIRSFDILGEENVALLTLIAGLSATRMFSSPTEKVMQQVVWDENLSPLSQHTRIRMAAMEILDQAMKMRLFHQDSEVVLDTERLGWRPSSKYSIKLKNSLATG
ncbi:hypothetical protein N0V83_007069 [Neocucurbitaria cava]|uniref:DUF6606 domain-containing protein n=1 Tax=Neocucurbitaria cava TaxID=798079 RepID=A0A9W9CKX3_9PLEO|nr:hypothetical protein N0V83_007069 [Neocucurbitaria cava]